MKYLTKKTGVENEAFENKLSQELDQSIVGDKEKAGSNLMFQNIVAKNNKAVEKFEMTQPTQSAMFDKFKTNFAKPSLFNIDMIRAAMQKRIDKMREDALKNVRNREPRVFKRRTFRNDDGETSIDKVRRD